MTNKVKVTIECPDYESARKLAIMAKGEWSGKVVTAIVDSHVGLRLVMASKTMGLNADIKAHSV